MSSRLQLDVRYLHGSASMCLSGASAAQTVLDIDNTTSAIRVGFCFVTQQTPGRGCQVREIHSPNIYVYIPLYDMGIYLPRKNVNGC